jgi:glycerophosphoryl diester phosphodiesterase
MHPFLKGLVPTIHISHRGGAALAPENTTVAFAKAVREHATQMLETDLQITSDGVLVVAHDDTVDRCTDGSGEIASMSLAQLQQLDAGYRFTPDGGQTFPFRGRGVRIPSLAEALRAFPGMRWNIELKSSAPGIERVFAQTVRREKAAERICCGSEADDVAARIWAALPEACHFHPGNALTAFVLAVRGGDPPVLDERFIVLDMPLEYLGVRLVDAPLIQAARETRRWINVWTIDDEAEMRRLVAEGVGGIMTDRPDILRRVLDEAPPGVGAGSFHTPHERKAT